MHTCANNTFLDYVIMFAEIIGAGLVLLILAGFLQRGVKKLADWAWKGLCRFVLPKEANE